MRSNPEIKNISAFIFDMDGTIVDSTEIDYRAWVRLFSDHEKEFMSYDEYKKLLGIKSADIIKEYLGFEGEDLEDALGRRLSYIKDIYNKEGLSAIPGAEDVLKQLKASGYKLALATGARKEKLEAVLERVNISAYFDVLITADEADKGKPSPALFLEAAKRLGVAPGECVVVEDAENGVLAAKNAGMRCIAITTTTPRESLKKADLIIGSYKDFDIEKFEARKKSVN